MKFLRNKQLRQLGAYLVLLTVVVFIAEYFLLSNRIAHVEEADLKIEYTQLAQLNNHKISLELQHFLQGDRSLAPRIVALIEEQDLHLKTLSSGGRIGQRNLFIKPLSRLPRITLDGLKESWNNYKESILFLMSQFEKTPPPPPAVADSLVATSHEPAKFANRSETALARLQYEGLSLSMSQWYDKLIEDLDEEVEERKSTLDRWKGGLVVINILVVTSLYFLFVTVVLKPIRVIGKNIADLKQMEGFPDNELGELAGQVNHTLENLKDATEFVMAIGRGNFTLDYKESLDKHYEKGRNKLADSLIEMQEKLRTLNEEEQKRKWANEGLAKFVDILRSSHDNLSLLGDKITSSLISYTRANQGALYILNDEDQSNKYLELISLFAWDVKKHEQQRIRPGQGLLGQAFLEKETTYITYLPEEYVRITSGLGDASPKAILIVPLKVDQDVYGLVELASFNEFQPHEISFVEKLGETIASTLANVRGAARNKVLIEQFRMQAEQMKAQEEEMRQNMEELQATQEEVSRKEQEYIARIRELETQQERMAEPGELSALRERLAQVENDYRGRMEALQKELELKSKNAMHWELAEQLHNEMRVHLAALKVTREVLESKRDE